MIISDLELFLIELPAAGGPIRSLLVHLVTDTGREGWGETNKAWRAAELPARRKMLLSALVGRETFEVESILAMDVLADRALACGVEMALWDAIARRAGQPLANLMGGVYRGSVPLSVRLPGDTPEAVVHSARAFAAQAITSQVIGSSGSVEGDLKLAATVRDACGDRLRLRLDADGRYELRAARQLCTGLNRADVEYVVDPLEDGELLRLGSLLAASPHVSTRAELAVSRAIESPADVMELARAEAVSLVVVDPARVGGIMRARTCALVAESAGLAASLRVERSSGLALAASLQLAAATPGFTSGHECAYPMLHDDILVEPLRMVDGTLAVPAGVGLGVQVDRDKVERYQVSG